MKKSLFIILTLAVIFCFLGCDEHPAHGVQEKTETRRETITDPKEYRIQFKADEYNFVNEPVALNTINDVADAYYRYITDAKDSETFTVQITGYASIHPNIMPADWLSYKRAEKVSGILKDVIKNKHNLTEEDIDTEIILPFEGKPFGWYAEADRLSASELTALAERYEWYRDKLNNAINFNEIKIYEWAGATSKFDTENLAPNRIVEIKIVSTIESIVITDHSIPQPPLTL